MKGAEFYQPYDLVQDCFNTRGTVTKVNVKQQLVWVYFENGQMAMRPEELTLLEREGEADLDLPEPEVQP